MIDSPAASAHSARQVLAQPQRPIALEEPLAVSWAVTWAEVREAQRLRYRVFAGEMGARVPSGRHGLDADEFDAYCDHLLVRDGTDGPVVGTYRVLLPAQANAAGGLYNDQAFDLSALDALRPRLAELGRACVDSRYRHGGVITALWSALAEFMAQRRIDWLLGSCSLPLEPSPIGPASLWRQLSRTHPAQAPWGARPLLPLRLQRSAEFSAPEAPPLLKGYLRIGARALGPPAWDSDFRCADLALLLRYEDLPARFRRHHAAAMV